MLYLLGDNSNWAVRPGVEDMATWALVRAVLRSADENAVEALAARFPEQVAAYQGGPKSWGLDWLRKCVEQSSSEPGDLVAAHRELGARLDALAGVRR